MLRSGSGLEVSSAAVNTVLAASPMHYATMREAMLIYSKLGSDSAFRSTVRPVSVRDFVSAPKSGRCTQTNSCEISTCWAVLCRFGDVRKLYLRQTQFGLNHLLCLVPLRFVESHRPGCRLICDGSQSGWALLRPAARIRVRLEGATCRSAVAQRGDD